MHNVVDIASASALAFADGIRIKHVHRRIFKTTHTPHQLQADEFSYTDPPLSTANPWFSIILCDLIGTHLIGTLFSLPVSPSSFRPKALLLALGRHGW
jgi:hypothetical protein